MTLTMPSISSSVGGLAELLENTRLIGSMRRDNDLDRYAISNWLRVSRRALSPLYTQTYYTMHYYTGQCFDAVGWAVGRASGL